jgi:hypothetical protein
MSVGEWLANQDAGSLIGLAAVVVGPMIAIVAILSGAWARVRRSEAQAQIAEAELALKQQMLERGISVDDMERILAAGQSRRGKPKTEPAEEQPA